MSRAEGLIRRALVDLSESTGINLREAEAVRLTATYRNGQVAYVCEIDALGKTDLLSSPMVQNEATLRASCAALRTIGEPSLASAPVVPILDEAGRLAGHLGVDTHARTKAKRG